jgi:hypothetical protein
MNKKKMTLQIKKKRKMIKTLMKKLKRRKMLRVKVANNLSSRGLRKNNKLGKRKIK